MALSQYPVAAAATAVLAQPGGNDGGGQGADFGKSSPLGLLILILFLIAVAFLVRSMTKHLKRVPATFDPDAESEQDAADQEGDESERAGDEETTVADHDREPAAEWEKPGAGSRHDA